MSIKNNVLRYISHYRCGLFSIVLLTWFTQAEPSATMPDYHQRESQFDQFLTQELVPFWQTVQQNSFTNQQGLRVHYAFIIGDETKPAIVISPGRVEGYLKYQELIFDFWQQGYSVFIIDHQGQGLSDRRLSNSHKGYVEHFEDYVNDFEQFINDIVRPRAKQPLYLVSHSMGGAIGMRFIQQHPDVFAKAVFSSPMWGLSAGPFPTWLADAFLNGWHFLASLAQVESPYFLGGTDYQPVNFEDNVLTHSAARYQWFRHTYEQNPALQLGGVTINWILESVAAIDRAYTNLDNVTIQVLVLQSGSDEVVDNAGQDRFCVKLAELNNPCVGNMPKVVADAHHELFIESDVKRSEALDAIFSYLND